MRGCSGKKTDGFAVVDIWSLVDMVGVVIVTAVRSLNYFSIRLFLRGIFYVFTFV